MLGALVRRYGQFDACEDAVQEALLEAATAVAGRRAAGRTRAGWLITVASRRLDRRLRSETPRRRREAGRRAAAAGARQPPDDRPSDDDTLTLLFLCCHPALSAPSQIALTLRAVGGLTTAADRRRVPGARGDDGAADQPGQAADQGRGAPVRAARRPPSGRSGSRVVLHVLYLIFNEGYTASRGHRPARAPS